MLAVKTGARGGWLMYCGVAGAADGAGALANCWKGLCCGGGAGGAWTAAEAGGGARAAGCRGVAGGGGKGALNETTAATLTGGNAPGADPTNDAGSSIVPNGVLPGMSGREGARDVKDP